LTDECEGEGMTNRFAYGLHSGMYDLIETVAVALTKKHAINMIEIQ